MHACISVCECSACVCVLTRVRVCVHVHVWVWAQLLWSSFLSTSGERVGSGGVAAQGGRCRLVEDAQLAEVLEAVQEGLLLLLGVGGQHLLGKAHPPTHAPTPPAVPIRRGGLRGSWGGRRQGSGSRSDGRGGRRCRDPDRHSWDRCGWS